MQLKAFYESIGTLYRAWGALAMTSDGSVCATSMSPIPQSHHPIPKRGADKRSDLLPVQVEVECVSPREEDLPQAQRAAH